MFRAESTALGAAESVAAMLVHIIIHIDHQHNVVAKSVIIPFLCPASCRACCGSGRSSAAAHSSSAC